MSAAKSLEQLKARVEKTYRITGNGRSIQRTFSGYHGGDKRDIEVNVDFNPPIFSIEGDTAPHLAKGREFDVILNFSEISAAYLKASGDKVAAMQEYIDRLQDCLEITNDIATAALYELKEHRRRAILKDAPPWYMTGGSRLKRRIDQAGARAIKKRAAE